MNGYADSNWCVCPYPDSEIAKEAKMAGLYYGFGGALGRRYMEAALLSSDEFMAVTFGGNWYDGGNYIHSSLHASRIHNTNLPFSLLWQFRNPGILYKWI